MKKLYFLLLLSFFLQKANAQWVTIPDANFVTFLQQNYPSCMNGNQMDTTCSAIVNATILNCSFKNISDLTGIEYFDNLQSLNSANNQLTSLPSLPASLTILWCNNNQLTSLPSLPSTLGIINCSANLLTFLPSLPLSLEKLDCYYNLLTTLPPLPALLTHLYCQYNQLSTLPSLSASLTNLICNSNQLTSLPSLPASLTILNCYENQLTSLPSLPASLTTLFCNNNQLTSLPPLPSSLYYINCFWNLLTTLPTLPASLNYLSCSYNQLTSLPAIPPNLKQLYCDNNLLVSLPELPDTLNYLYINDNPNLNCLPQLKIINGFQFYNTAIQCLPNYGDVTYSSPPLNSLPLCSTSITTQITSSSTSLCGISSITLSADTGTGYSYQWQLNGNNISGAASQTYDATVAGDYSVIVTYNCALDTSNTIIITSGAAPSAAITSTGPVSFCAGSSVTFDANTGTGLSYQWQLDGNNINGATSHSYTATITGNYSVIVSNNCGNSISNIITVTITSAPGSAGTISGPTSFCRHTTQTFTVSPVVDATNYVWSVPPQATITYGLGTNSIVVNFKVKQGNVTLKAANQCGAGPLSVLPVQVVKCFHSNNAVMRSSSISESDFELYPNPASSEVKIRFNSETENNYLLKLYDIHGRIVLKQNSIAVKGINELTFDVEFLSKGVYMLEISTADERMMKKLIVQ